MGYGDQIYSDKLEDRLTPRHITRMDYLLPNILHIEAWREGGEVVPGSAVSIKNW